VPLILAIESNRNQTNQIAQMVKHYLRGAELITAPSAESALAALGSRIPDLILTPALIGPRDEAALTDHLRQLGSAAAHIHTLSTPIIESTKPRNRDQGGGLLGRRRDKSDASGVGCDPQVFAEQIKVYLDRAARERDVTLDAAADSHPAPDTATPSSGADDDFAEMDWLTDEPVVADPPPAAPPVESRHSPGAAFEPPVVAPVYAAQKTEAVVKAEAPVAEKRQRPPSSQATRAFEAEFGLPSAISQSPPLWRVTEEGIEALSEEPPPVVADPPAPIVTSAAAASAADQPSVRSTPKPAKPVKAKKSQAPPVDDWAYFDPQQSPFRSLLKRLDEIAGYAH
jgi:CheY-like chemotaxis protein